MECDHIQQFFLKQFKAFYFLERGNPAALPLHLLFNISSIFPSSYITTTSNLDDSDKFEF